MSQKRYTQRRQLYSTFINSSLGIASNFREHKDHSIIPIKHLLVSPIGHLQKSTSNKILRT